MSLSTALPIDPNWPSYRNDIENLSAAFSQVMEITETVSSRRKRKRDEHQSIALTVEEVEHIFSFLPPRDLLAFSLCNKQFLTVIKERMEKAAAFSTPSHCKDLSEIPSQDDKCFVKKTALKINRAIDCILPSCIQSLHLGDSFDQKIDHLPQGLVDLELGRDFNQTIDHLPSTLKNLVLGSHFNQPIDHLPSSLISIQVGKRHTGDFITGCFNHSIDCLPQTLQFLTLGLSFNQNVDHLPASLQSLKFSSLSFFNRPLKHLPQKLVELKLGITFNQPIDHLPASLEILIFGEKAHFNRPMVHLPSGLKYLIFNKGARFNQPLRCLPRGLTHLRLAKRFRCFLNKLPGSVTYLALDKKSPLRAPSNFRPYRQNNSALRCYKKPLSSI